MDGVDMTIDTTTGIVPAYGLIATPGAIDCHVHILGAEMMADYLALGYTTLIGGGMGLVFDVGTNPRFSLERMMDAFAAWPINMAFISRASSSAPPLEALARVGRVRVQDPRGPGRVPGRDRPDASGCRRARRPGHDPHRLDQRVGVARGHDRRDRRADDPRVPRRGRGRRARARPARDRLRAPRAAVLDEPDQPVLVVGHQGAPRHDHVGAPDEPGDPRGRGVRAVARAAGDDGRRGRAPRSRRHLDDRRRLRRAWGGLRRPCAAASSSPT